MDAPHWIDGQPCPGSGSATFKSLNPARPDQVVAGVTFGTQADVDSACRAARGAYGPWRGLSGPARAEHLFAWAERIKLRAGELAQAMAAEVGKPIGEARGEIGRCVAILRYFAGEAVRTHGEVVPPQVAGRLQYSLRVPLGVVGLITPWNFPFAIPLWKAAPALAMGNTVVLKPSEHSAYCASLLAQTSDGLPSGAFNVVQGDVSTGKALVSHPDLRAVSFTGSVGGGRDVGSVCALRNVKHQAEMGGKNAAVVLPDADFRSAAALVAGGAMRFAGQKCTATSRAIVVGDAWDGFVPALVEACRSLPIGDPADDATAVGPVICREAQERILGRIAGTSAATVFAAETPSQGFFVPPTVLGPVAADDPLAQEEVFGPVLVLIRAQDFNHAVEIANSTPFGLSTALYTKDTSLSLRFIDQVEAGLVRINGDTTGVDPHTPFGGTKASSSGTREQGTVAKDFYSEWKTVQINP